MASKIWWKEQEIVDLWMVVEEINLVNLVNEKKSRSHDLYKETERRMQLMGHQKT